jgi:hypothetical protein
LHRVRPLWNKNYKFRTDKKESQDTGKFNRKTTT